MSNKFSCQLILAVAAMAASPLVHAGFTSDDDSKFEAKSKYVEDRFDAQRFDPSTFDLSGITLKQKLERDLQMSAAAATQAQASVHEWSGDSRARALAVDVSTFRCSLWNLLAGRLGASGKADNLFTFLAEKFTSIQAEPPVSSVPLPAAAWLFGAGLIGLGARAKRQRRSDGATIAAAVQAA